jgi:hypothetical protein
MMDGSENAFAYSITVEFASSIDETLLTET